MLCFDTVNVDYSFRKRCQMFHNVETTNLIVIGKKKKCMVTSLRDSK